jgi:hypothetical protein
MQHGNMRTILMLSLLALLPCAGQSVPGLQKKLAVAQVKDDAKLNRQYHKLVVAMKVAQVQLQEHVAGRDRACKALAKALQMSPDGDLTCVVPPPPAPPAPASKPVEETKPPAAN